MKFPTGHVWLMTLLLSIYFLGLTDVQVIAPILPLLHHDFQVSFALVGIVVSVYAITGAAWALVVGPLSDRFGRVGFIRAAAVLFAFASLMAFATTGFKFYLAARILAGLAGGVFSACIIAQIADLFPFEQRGRAMGLVAGVYALSAVIGVPLGTFAASALGWRSIYLAFAIPALLLAVLLRPARGSAKDLAAAKDNEPHRSGTAYSVRALVRAEISQYKQFWLQPATRRGLIIALAVAGTSTSLITFLGAWLTGTFSMSMNMVGVVFLLTGAAMVAGSVAGGWMSDWLGKNRLFQICSAGLAFFMLFVFGIDSQPQAIAWCMLGGFVISLREGAYHAIITELVPSSKRGAYVAMRSTVAKLAMAAAAAIGGILFEISGFPAVALFAGGLSLLAVFGIRGQIAAALR